LRGQSPRSKPQEQNATRTGSPFTGDVRARPLRSWSSNPLSSLSRAGGLRLALGLLLLGALLWALPIRRPGEDGGHHRPHAPGLDAFERAGVTEFKEGQRGPAIGLPALAGGRGSLETYQDKLVVLNFWATWCQPCDVEMPTLEALWREYGPRGLVVIGISVDRGAPRAVLEPYVANKKLTFPIWLDPEMKTASAWRVTGLPATFLVRPGGEVAGVALGAREWDSEPMRALLEQMLPRAQRH
jgi:peroxiredoxin